MSDGITIIIDGKKIKICQNVLDIMRKYIQKGRGSLESGGLLIGKENISNENLIINHITVPMTKDKKKYNRFFRKDKRHIEVFNNLYEASDETLRYIGEWHTHPEAIPGFSNIDLNNWQKISKNSSVETSYYHVIVGFKVIKVWIMESTMQQARFIATISWKDVK